MFLIYFHSSEFGHTLKSRPLVIRVQFGYQNALQTMKSVHCVRVYIFNSNLF